MLGRLETPTQPARFNAINLARPLQIPARNLVPTLRVGTSLPTLRVCELFVAEVPRLQTSPRNLNSGESSYQFLHRLSASRADNDSNGTATSEMAGRRSHAGAWEREKRRRAFPRGSVGTREGFHVTARWAARDDATPAVPSQADSPPEMRVAAPRLFPRRLRPSRSRC